MTENALRILSPHFAIRLFVVALAVAGGLETAHADTAQPAAATPVVPVQDADPAQSLTPIRRGSDPEAHAGARPRTSSLTSTLAVLGLVLGGSYVAVNLLHRRLHARSAQSQAIDLLASRPLDGHSTLHLVRIGRRVLAVGSSSGGTNTLAVIDDPEEIAQLISASGDSRPSVPPTAWKLFRRRTSPASAHADTGSTANKAPVFLGNSGRAA